MTFIKRKDLAKVALFMLNSSVNEHPSMFIVKVEKVLMEKYGITKDSAETVIRDAQAELFKDQNIMSTKCGVVL